MRQLQIPLIFKPKDEHALKHDLERLAKGVSDFATALPAAVQLSPDISPANVLALDAVTRVSLRAGDVLVLQLPQIAASNGNRQLYIKRETRTGTCIIKAVGCTIDGRASRTLPAALGLYPIYFDSQNYYALRALATDWSGV